jgi:hypothetical protein
VNTAPSPETMVVTLRDLNTRMRVLLKLYTKAHEIAYSRARSSETKIRVAGSDPTGELATDFVDERGNPTQLSGIRHQVASVATTVGGLSSTIDTAIATLVQLGTPAEIPTRKVKRWTRAEIREAQREAWQRVEAEGRVARR